MKEKHAQVEKERSAHTDAPGQDALDWVRQLTYGGRDSERETANRRGSGAGSAAGAGTGAGEGADAGAAGFGHDVERLKADQWRGVQAVAMALAHKSQ